MIDHHAAEAELPPAIAIVNPNRLDQEKGYGHLCAAGMTFLLAVAVNLRLKRAGWFDGKEGRPAAAPDLMSYLDLVALGTVCDVVPLTTINRAFVMRGLPYLSDRYLPGIKALAEVADCRDEIDARACGFALGPRINAGGRIGEFRLRRRTAAGNRCRAGRRSRAHPERAQCRPAGPREGGHRGGAGADPRRRDPRRNPEDRDRHRRCPRGHRRDFGCAPQGGARRPGLRAGADARGDPEGSGRSVSGFDLGAAIIAARKAGLLIKGGGHAMAGGITLETDRVEEFRAFLDAEIEKSDYFSTGVVSKVDATIQIDQATVGLVEAAQSLAPFGMGNPTPRFVIRGVTVADVRILKDKHLKLCFEDPEMREAGKRVDGLIWNAVGTPFGEALQDLKGQVVDVLGGLEINEWRGRKSVQVKIDDIRPAA